MSTDAEAEAFLASDLSDLDFSQFAPARFRFAPGQRAKRSGLYELIGPRGGRTGDRLTLVRGQIFPPAPKGRVWTLVEPAHQGGEE